MSAKQTWLADKEQKTTAVIDVAIPADRNIREKHEDILFIIKDNQSHKSFCRSNNQEKYQKAKHSLDSRQSRKLCFILLQRNSCFAYKLPL